MTGIYGVTRREDLDERVKVLGKLRKGAEKRPNAPGRDLEYFRFTSDNDAVVRAFREAYGDKPDSLEVYFPYPNYESVFHTARELFGQNHLLKEQCDGMYITQRQDGYKMARGRWLCEKKCKDTESSPPCPDCPLQQIGRLSVILTPLFFAGFPGTVTLETHSWHDLGHIASQLAHYEPLTGRAFRVYRQETRIGRPDKKNNKRAATDKWLVKIEPTQETAILLIEDAQRKARQALGAGAAPAPRLEAGQPLMPDMVVETDVVDLEAELENDYDEFVEEDGYAVDEVPESEGFTTWSRLKEMAVERIGYSDVGEVTRVLKSIFDSNKDELTFAVAWTALIEHQESRAAQEPPIDELEF
jgi:hypothetical protein